MEDHPSTNGKFGHLLLLQKEIDREAICQALRPYFESAHLDARQVFHADIGIDLHPDAGDGDERPIEYPGCLPSTTRKGLFGEVMAGLVTEGYELVGAHDWCVPIFLFRYHEDARNYLFALARNPERKRQTIGRLGSDFIGLLLDEDGAVVRFIAGEAKWRKTLTQSAVDAVMYGKKVANPAGGAKIHSGKGVWNDVNNDPPVPIGVRQLMRLLQEHDPDGYDAAILSMERALVVNDPEPLPRTDLIIIVGNGAATREKMNCLLPFKEMPDDYTAGHDLQLVEVILEDGEELIGSLYESLWSDGGGDA
ncbi:MULTISPECIES: aminotransferase [Rhodopseudomonas]|uniref:aminotransferase n=1 Tax=Rhodopseudomonas TaxID=1073 RepID=UPI001F2AD3AA|nr:MULTISPECIES: aminotransferase [Rhodopseudomonas]MDF3814333.1 aminotransferase [Rhodopseudomonas sp. BAL398]WOK18029.1 aminotransferase [Rhodopseudomonas sp. BAL398]